MGETPTAPKAVNGTHVSRNYVVFSSEIRACARVFLNCSGEGASKRRMSSCRTAHRRLPCWLNSTCGQASNQLLLVGLESAVLIRKLAAVGASCLAHRGRHSNRVFDVPPRRDHPARPVSTHWVARWASSAADATPSLFFMCSRWDSIVLTLLAMVPAI